MKDYYRILEISKDSDSNTIKKAFRKLAMKYHPDKNPEKDTGGLFKEIYEAYEILIDPVKRTTYDSMHTVTDLQFEPAESRRETYSDKSSSFEDWVNVAQQKAEKAANLPYEQFIKMLTVTAKITSGIALGIVKWVLICICAILVGGIGEVIGEAIGGAMLWGAIGGLIGLIIGGTIGGAIGDKLG